MGYAPRRVAHIMGCLDARAADICAPQPLEVPALYRDEASRYHALHAHRRD